MKLWVLAVIIYFELMMSLWLVCLYLIKMNTFISLCYKFNENFNFNLKNEVTKIYFNLMFICFL